MTIKNVDIIKTMLTTMPTVIATSPGDNDGLATRTAQ